MLVLLWSAAAVVLVRQLGVGHDAGVAGDVERVHSALEERGWLWAWLGGGLVVGLGAVAATAWATSRAGSPAAPRPIGADSTSARLRALARVTQTLQPTEAVDEALQRVVEGAVEIFGAKVAGLWLYEDDGRYLSLRACAGVVAALDPLHRFPAHDSLVAAVLTKGEAMRITAMSGDLRHREHIRAAGLVSGAAAPLRAGERQLGVVAIADAERREYSADDLSVLQALAVQAAFAIETASVFAAERTRQSYLTALLDINKKIGAMVSTETLLTSIAEEAARLLGVDNAGFRLLDGEDLVLAGLAGTARQTMKRPRLRVGESLSGQVVASGRTMMVDIASAPGLVPEHREADRQLGYTTVLGVPLRVGERTIGALTFRARRPFTAGDQDLAEAFAGQAAVAIEHSRLYQETARSAERMTALADLGRLLSDTLDPDVVGQRIVDSVRRLIDVHSAALLRLNPESGDLEVMSAAEAGPTLRPGVIFPRGTGTSGFAVQTRQPVITSDLLSDPRFSFTADVRARIEEAGYRSVMTIPLVVRDTVIGAMSVGDVAGRLFDAQEIRLARAFADEAALALENARLFAEGARRRREAEELARVAQTLTASLDVEAVGNRIVESVLPLFGVELSGVRLLEPDGALVLVAVGGSARGHFETGHVQQPGEGFLAQVVATETAQSTTDLLADRRFHYTESLRSRIVEAGHRGMLAVPLRAKGRLIGVLYIASLAERVYSEAETALLQAFGDQAALALENARLYAEATRRLDETRALLEVAEILNSRNLELSRQREVKLRETEILLSVSRALSSTLDQDALLRHFLQLWAGMIDADTVGVWTVDDTGEWLDPLVGYRVPRERLADLRATRLSLVSNDFYGEAARTRRPAFSRDVSADPRLPRALVELVPHRSQLFVPIVVKDRMIGGLAALWWERVREFGETDLGLTEAIANQAGVTLENLRLFGENRRQVNELSVLYDLSRAVTGQLDRDALVDAIHTHVARVLDAQSFVLVLRSPDTPAIDLVYTIVEGRRHLGHPPEYGRWPVGLISVVLERGRALRTEDYLGECARHGVEPVSLGLPVRHVVIVPMKIGEAVLGALAVGSTEGAFSRADERLLTNIADLGALALASARLFEERERAYRELATAHDELVRTERLRALGEMASGIAHDFNNLLASILGRAQLLLRRVEDPGLVRWLQVIERAALDGARTVQRLQEFTRVRRDAPLVAVDLNQVVMDALEMTQSRWREEPQSRGVTIDMRTELTPLPLMAGDPAGLREAFTNLILNAVDAMPSGGILTVRTHAADGRIDVIVRDTGVGMAESVREKIFDPFFTTKGPQGTGLGLSMTYGIVSRHGATIAVDTQESAGSTFTLTFPLTAAPDPAAPASPPDGTPVPVRPLRCLIVDDEEAVGTVLADMLEVNGHEAVVLTDSAAAIERFRSEAFDVVFTDLAMPGVSGWQVTRAVKRIAPTVPVFLVTGFGVELSAEERQSQGVEAVLVKPVTVDDLLEAVAQAGAFRST